MFLKSNDALKLTKPEKLKRKRKLSSDSLVSLEEADDDEISKLPTGINVQVIAQHDKKLIKLNASNRTQHTTHNLNRPIYKPIVQTSMSALNDIDDLPSESDVSTGMILVPLSNHNSSNSSLLTPSSASSIKTLKTTTNISICYKCMRCNRIFNDESLFKMHQSSGCDTISNSSISHQVQMSVVSPQTLNRRAVNDIANEELEKLLFSYEHSSFETTTSELNSINQNQPRTQQVQLDRRTTVKVPNRPPRVYICNECGIQFHLQSDLNRHMLQAHESSKAFDELAATNRHEKEHASVKLLRCYICSFEFTRASNLRTHICKVHPNEIGKLVHITKSEDNKLKFEFDLGMISMNQVSQIIDM